MLKKTLKNGLLGIAAIISMNVSAIAYTGQPKSFEIKVIKKTEEYKNFSDQEEFKKLNIISKYYVISFLKDLTLKQQQTILWAFETGKQFDLSYSLAAIAWKESLGGLVDINLFDKPYGSCGVFHNNLKTVIGDMTPEDHFILNKFNLNKLCSKLQHNRDYSLMEAVKVLRCFQKKYKNNWMKIWAAYNGGNAHPNKNYAKDIYFRIQALKYIITIYYENNIQYI